MQKELLKLLVCPIEKTGLEFMFISEFEKEYSAQKITEIKEGLLFSKAGFIFPIIDGVPRILLEAIYDYSDFIKKHFDGYEKTKEQLELKYRGLLDYCVRKNSRTKKSFEFEWSFLNEEKKDKIWNDDISELSNVFLRETGCDQSYFSDKTIIDVGCGHGVMTTKIAEMAVERAKRLVEYGKDVVILMDSITRLARSYNVTAPPSGRTLSGGFDPVAIKMCFPSSMLLPLPSTPSPSFSTISVDGPINLT